MLYNGYLTNYPVMGKRSVCWVEVYTLGQVTDCKLTSNMVKLVS